ncbi:MAG TPA: hypothetical protein VMT56_03245 [Candidatus Bathyarchaeia archaeon]|nr:hypothetical protein [Candidatus Bathyarchaeia archaeon]
MEEQQLEWEELKMVDDVYYKMLHIPCGTTVQILVGYRAVCPKCQPEEWRKRAANDHAWIALDCVARGWYVFPCKPRSKGPFGALGNL